MIEPSEEVKRVEQRYEKALDDMEKHYKDVIEQIREEIEEIKEKMFCTDDEKQGLDVALSIIDKHTKGDNKE